MKITVSFTIAFWYAALASPALAVVMYTGDPISENFDSLPTSHMLAFFAANGVPTPIPGDAGWVAARIEDGSEMNLRAGDFPGFSGSGNAGIHSFGPADPAEKAQGILAAGDVTPAMGVEIVNMSGGLLSEVTIAFTQETWRRPGAGAGSDVGTVNVTSAEYATTGSGITSETIFTATSGFTSVSSLDLVSVPPEEDPGTAGTHLPATVILGNAPANQESRTATIDFSSDPIGVGQSFFLRYIEVNDVGGDATMAVDDFTFTATSIPVTESVADYNGDGAVDAADYTVWRDQLGSDMSLPNDDGLGTPIGEDHYELWRSNFGQAASSHAAAAPAAAVPEPSFTGLMLMALVGAAIRRPRLRGDVIHYAN